MAKRHVMTPARRAALRKAQLASARKRRNGARLGKAIRKGTGRVLSNYIQVDKATGKPIKGKRQSTKQIIKSINRDRARRGKGSVQRAAAKGAGKIAADVSVHQTLKSIHPGLGVAYSAAMAGRSYSKTRKKKKRR